MALEVNFDDGQEHPDGHPLAGACARKQSEVVRISTLIGSGDGTEVMAATNHRSTSLELEQRLFRFMVAGGT